MEVRPPAVRPAKGSAAVILRPVSLLRLSELVGGDQNGKLAVERRRWAEDLVRFDSGLTTATQTAKREHYAARLPTLGTTKRAVEAAGLTERIARPATTG